MNDIKPVRRPNQGQPNPQQPTGQSPNQPRPLSGNSGMVSPESQPRSTVSGDTEMQSVRPDAVAPPIGATPAVNSPIKQPRKHWKIILVIIAVVLLVAAVASLLWYRHQLSAVSSNESAQTIAVEIPSGSTPGQIASILADKSLIRSKLAFDIHTRLKGTRNGLLAGTYRLSSAESTPEIVNHLTSGQVDEFTVTFYPGSALNFTSGTDKTPSHRAVLEQLGYSDEEISRAFAADYNHPLLATKPKSADLEGYIYGQTYQISSGASVEQILTRTFDEFYKQLQSNNVLTTLANRNMTLHDAIILASVVEREVSTGGDDQRQVAQVFHLRLEKDMPLGADATFVYAAKRLGQTPSVGIDSPYNTRKYKGLPPGPIASPGIGAMKAVASPADGDYLYFVSGDDGRNYFSKTIEEHEAKTREHCIENCNLF